MLDHHNKTAPWRRWYGTQRWRKRARYQLLIEPWCKTCADKGIAQAARAADHIHPHRGDYDAFHFGALQSLCSNCHDQAKRYAELRGFTPGTDLDGFPTDPEHPAYR
jgi:5-methylcytosine-specific restriction endonuclease McrA